VLHQQGHNLFVYTHRKQGQVYFQDAFEVRHFPWLGNETSLTSLKPKKPWDIIKALSLLVSGTIGLPRYVAEKSVDFCLAMWAIPSGYFTYQVKVKLGIPYIVWALGSDIWTIRKYPFGKSLLRCILKEASHILADGKLLAQDVESISGKFCEFLPSSRMLPLEHNGEAEVDRSKVNFLFIGRLHPNKGPDLLLEAFQRLMGYTNKAHLYVFGKGPLEHLLGEMVRNFKLESKVTLKGYASPETVVEWLRACDCLVIPSRIESIPLIFSDAMQAGTPVIVSDVGDMGKLVNEYKVGLVVRHPKELADVLRTFQVKGDRSAYRKNTVKARRLFDLEMSAKHIIDLMDRTVD